MKRRNLVVRTWLGICLTVLTVGAAADALPPRIGLITLDIKSQPIGAALNELAQQAGIQVLFYSDVANGLSAPALVGTFTPDVALTQLLSNTGLTYSYVNTRTVAIHRVGSTVSERKATRKEAGRPVMRLANNEQISEEPKNEVVQKTGSQEVGRQNSNEERRNARIEEVIVTAQKRQERLIDVPQAVSVLSTDYLANLAATQFRDFANTVPGLSFTTVGAGFTQISLRGVTVGVDIGPTVGIYVDEVPYGSSGKYGTPQLLALDVGLFDLDRIEVLRGPQGTLYGASSLGGLIKYVTKQPDASRFGVQAQTGVSDTHDGGVSYHGAIAFNAPIVADKAALRATGFYSRDGGYIDNVALGEKDVNRADIHGGRADLLLTPTDAFSIRITGFLQYISRDGEATANYTLAGAPVDGSLGQRRLLDEGFDQRFRLASGTVTYDLDWASLTSLSSYQTVQSEFLLDISRSVSLCAFVARSCSALGQFARATTDKFTQEVRLVSEGTQALEWVIGGFYTHETTEDTAEFVLRDLAGQPAPNDLFTFLAPSRYEERAAFGDLTWHLTDKFNVTGGVRFARNSQRFEQIGSGFFGRSTPTRSSSDDVFTYLANARYHFSDRATGYLRYATGYRPGGPNTVTINSTTGLPAGPETYEADGLKSYEVGFKAETADRRFGIDVAGYFIDWDNFIVSVIRGGFGTTINAPGGASVRGAELTLTARSTPTLTVTGAFAYQDAELSEADPDLRAAKGERLPNVPRFTAALNADYELPVGSLRPTVGTTLRYVDDRTASFNDSRTRPQYHLPDYTMVDLRAGVTLDRFNVQLYVRNLFDKRGQLSAATLGGTARTAILQPRTIGVMASTEF